MEKGGRRNMFCSNCGERIDTDSHFCIHCGHRVAKKSSPQTTAPDRGNQPPAGNEMQNGMRQTYQQPVNNQTPNESANATAETGDSSLYNDMITYVGKKGEYYDRKKTKTRLYQRI